MKDPKPYKVCRTHLNTVRALLAGKGIKARIIVVDPSRCVLRKQH